MSDTIDTPALPRFRALQYRFAAHLRDPANNPAPEGLEDRRVAIYRDLFYNNVQGLLAGNFPVIRKILPDERWHALVRDFFAHHPSHTPLFTEIGREFVRFLQERAERDAGDPPFLPELAHYEWAELAVAIDEADIADVPHDPHGDVLAGVPVPSPVAWPLAYRFPVQRIRADYQPEAAPEQPTFLIVVRRRDDQVSFLETSAAILQLLQHLQENPGSTGQVAVDAIVAAFPPEHRAGAAAAATDALRDLHARDVLLGTTIT